MIQIFVGFEYAYLVNKMTSNERHALEEEITFSCFDLPNSVSKTAILNTCGLHMEYGQRG
jgi:hypothetical protein